jgi:hypothetical protein
MAAAPPPIFTAHRRPRGHLNFRAAGKFGTLPTMSINHDVIPLTPLGRRSRLGPRSRVPAVAIAELAIADFRDDGFDLRLAGGDLFVQEGGTWRIASKSDLQYLRVLVQRHAEEIGKVKVGDVNAAWRALNASPRLFSRDVPQIPDPPAVLTNGTTSTIPIPCPVAQWASEALVRMDHGRIERSDLLVAFHQWCAATGNVVPLAAIWFFPRLRVACRPYLRTITVMGTRYAAGIYWTPQSADAGAHRSDRYMTVQPLPARRSEAG